MPTKNAWVVVHTKKYATNSKRHFLNRRNNIDAAVAGKLVVYVHCIKMMTKAHTSKE